MTSSAVHGGMASGKPRLPKAYLSRLLEPGGKGGHHSRKIRHDSKGWASEGGVKDAGGRRS